MSLLRVLPVMRAVATVLLCGCAASSSTAAPPEASPLAGTWRYVPARSTELSAWVDLRLTLTVTGDVVVLERTFTTGRRTFTDRLSLDTNRSVTTASIEWWPDNRHLGAYVGANQTRHVRTQWFDDRRLLRLSTDLVLETQQGSRAVNILSDYKVSASGRELTVTELRSTRRRPIVYVFQRATP